MGRPTDCTPETTAAVARAVLEGCSLADAAALAGVTDTTVDRWMKRGQDGEEPFAGFRAAVLRARAEAKAEAIRNVRAGRMLNGERDWKAEAWYLERSDPATYGPQQVVAVKFEQELEKALARLDAVKPAIVAMAREYLVGLVDAKPGCGTVENIARVIGENAHDLVCAALAGERDAETPGGASR